jgi:hypothetical protein
MRSWTFATTAFDLPTMITATQYPRLRGGCHSPTCGESGRAACRWHVSSIRRTRWPGLGSAPKAGRCQRPQARLPTARLVRPPRIPARAGTHLQRPCRTPAQLYFRLQKSVPCGKLSDQPSASALNERELFQLVNELKCHRRVRRNSDESVS